MDTLREEVPFWVRFQGRRTAAIHVATDDCNRDDPETICQYRTSSGSWDFGADHFHDQEIRDRLCEECKSEALGLKEDTSKYARTPAEVLEEAGLELDDDDDEASVPVTDGGRPQFSAVSSRRRTRKIPTPHLFRRQHLARDRPLALRRSLLRPRRDHPHRSSTNWCCFPCSWVGALGDITLLPIDFGGICPDILPEETTIQWKNEDREVRADGGEFEEIYRRETITEGPDGDLRIGDRELVEEIDNVCAALEAIREVVENPDVGDTLQTAISHTWQASILQRIDENTDVRMISSSGSSGVSLHGPNPGTFKRDRGESQ